MKLSLQKIAKLALSSSCPTPPPFSPVWPWSQAHSLFMTSLLNPHGSLSSATSLHSWMVVRSRLIFAIVGVGRRTINEAWDVYKWIFLNFKINSRTEIQWMEQISKLHDFHATLWLEWQEEEKGTKENIWGLNSPFGLPAEAIQQLTGKKFSWGQHRVHNIPSVVWRPFESQKFSVSWPLSQIPIALDSARPS